MSHKIPEFDTLNLTQLRDRKELAEAVYRMLGPFSGKLLLTYDSHAIMIFAFPREGELFKVGKPTRGEMRDWNEYNED